MEELIGQVVAEKYILNRLLGEGGMGRVYLGLQLPMKRKVAIKLLHDDLAKEPRFVSRLEQEAFATSQVTHPNSVTLFDFGKDSFGVYLVMEYLEGESLWDRLQRKGRLSPRETVSILSQVIEPLTCCHEQGVVHRDLKPDNIMLCKIGGKEIVKLLDYGIARVNEGPAVTRTGQILGTPVYMSPEQIIGKGLSPSSDIYSLGIILYELLTGVLPFEDTSQLELFRKHISEKPPRLSTMFPEESWLFPFDPVIEKALQKAPSERFLSVSLLKKALQKALKEVEKAPNIIVPLSAVRVKTSTLLLEEEVDKAIQALEDTLGEEAKDETMPEEVEAEQTVEAPEPENVMMSPLLEEETAFLLEDTEDFEDVENTRVDAQLPAFIKDSEHPQESVEDTPSRETLLLTQKMPEVSPAIENLSPVEQERNEQTQILSQEAIQSYLQEQDRIKTIILSTPDAPLQTLEKTPVPQNTSLQKNKEIYLLYWQTFLHLMSICFSLIYTFFSQRALLYSRRMKKQIKRVRRKISSRWSKRS